SDLGELPARGFGRGVLLPERARPTVGADRHHLAELQVPVAPERRLRDGDRNDLGSVPRVPSLPGIEPEKMNARFGIFLLLLLPLAARAQDAAVIDIPPGTYAPVWIAAGM